MNAQHIILSLLAQFVNCFTRPGFFHFQHFIQSHMALLGLPHCVTEVMRLSGVHEFIRWTTPYAFVRKGRWSCLSISQRLLELITKSLSISEEIIIAIDDTLVKKWGKHFFGLGFYPDPTDKNPGAHKRRVLGHCWVVLALLWEYRPGLWVGFPLCALVFVPKRVCPENWPFLTKIELAKMLIEGLHWPARRLIVVVDNLYAKAKLASLEDCVLVSRLRSNAALYLLPQKPKQPKRGRPRLRGPKRTPMQLYRCRRARKKLKVRIYGKTITVDAFVGIVMPSRSLGSEPIVVVIFPQRSAKKMNVFFSTDITMDAVRLLEIYAARFKIEDIFDELKTTGGLGDYRQRSFKPIKRHVTLCLVAYSLLRLVSVTMKGAETIEAEPWWRPQGPPSVTRLRRAVFKALRISEGLHSNPNVDQNILFREAD